MPDTYECLADALNRGDLVLVNVSRSPLDTPDRRWLELTWIDVLVDDDECPTGQLRLTFQLRPRHTMEVTVSDDQPVAWRRAVRTCADCGRPLTRYTVGAPGIGGGWACLPCNTSQPYPGNRILEPWECE